MFPGRYFAGRFFAGRFFPKVGAAPLPPSPTGDTPHMLFSNGLFDPTDQPVMRSVTVHVTSAELLNIFTVPITILPAPGANKLHVVHKAVVYLVYNSVAYVNPGGSASLFYGTSALGLPVYNIANALWIKTTNFLFGPDQTALSSAGTSVPSAIINTGIVLAKTTANLTTGNSPITINLTYYTIDLS